MANAFPIALAPQRRGDEFNYSSILTGSWVASNFTGGLRFTLRDEVPASASADDADAIDQASVATGEITFQDSTSFTIVIPASRTKTWPTDRLYWDLQGTVTGSPNRVFTLAAGRLLVLGDITRTQ